MNMSNTRKSQSGAATLFVAMVLLAMITAVAIFAAKFSAQDIRINANDYRSFQAQAAAQAGVDHIASVLNKKDIVSSVLATPSVTVLTIPTTTINFSSGGNTYLAGSYQVTYEISDADSTAAFLTKNNIINVTSKGMSSDNVATKTIETRLRFSPLFIAPIKTNIVAKGDVLLGNNTTIVNNESKGFVWNGGNITNISGSTSLTNSSTLFSSSLANKPQLLPNDTTFSTTLAPATTFFRSFFPIDHSMLTKVASNTSGVMRGGKLYNASGNLSGTIGGINDPVVIMVSASEAATFNLVGATIYGVVYIDGDWTHQNDASGSTIHGALVVNGTFRNENNGKLNVTYNWNNVLDVIPNYVGIYQTIAGSWVEK